jgi:hypothetical protein
MENPLDEEGAQLSFAESPEFYQFHPEEWVSH